MFEKMKEIVCEYVEVEPEEITNESRFIEDLGFNSYDVMCMMGDTEDKFDVEIDQEEAVKCKTVGDFIKYIGGLVNE